MMHWEKPNTDTERLVLRVANSVSPLYVLVTRLEKIQKLLNRLTVRSLDHLASFHWQLSKNNTELAEKLNNTFK